MPVCWNWRPSWGIVPACSCSDIPTRSSVTRFTRSDNGELEFRLNVQMTLRQLNQLLSTNIHNDVIRGIEVIDESSS